MSHKRDNKNHHRVLFGGKISIICPHTTRTQIQWSFNKCVPARSTWVDVTTKNLTITIVKIDACFQVLVACRVFYFMMFGVTNHCYSKPANGGKSIFFNYTEDTAHQETPTFLTLLSGRDIAWVGNNYVHRYRPFSAAHSKNLDVLLSTGYSTISRENPTVSRPAILDLKSVQEAGGVMEARCSRTETYKHKISNNSRSQFPPGA